MSKPYKQLGSISNIGAGGDRGKEPGAVCLSPPVTLLNCCCTSFILIHTYSFSNHHLQTRNTGRSEVSRPATSSVSGEGRGQGVSRTSSGASHSTYATAESSTSISTRRAIDPAIKMYVIPKDEPVYNIDDGDEMNCTQCTEYVDEVYAYYKELEVSNCSFGLYHLFFCSSSTYLGKVEDIT